MCIRDSFREGYLDPSTKIFGYARSKLSMEDLKSRVLPHLKKPHGESDDAKIEQFFKMISYIAGNYDTDEGFDELRTQVEKFEKSANVEVPHRHFYLALPPSVFLTVAKQIKSRVYAEKGITRVIVEKPFGHDLTSARELQKNLGPLFKEEDNLVMTPKEQEGNIYIRGTIDVEKVIVKLFDGYDWKYTRKFIAKTVEKLDKELSELEENSLKSNVIQSEANIFDSIYISANQNNVTDLRKNLDGEIQGVQNSFSDVSKVNLRPSKHYKALLQLSKLQVNLKNYRVDEPDESESDNSTDVLNRCVVSVYEFEIIDNVPTSTWNKFVTLLKHEPWPHNSPMFLLNLEFFRPIDFLQAVELVMQLKIAPLRLHVDQDTLEFLIRFLGFKDKRFELVDEYPDIIFVQKFSTNPIKLRLDYKPKKVDYAGLRSGQTSELMNFFTLDGSKIILKSVVLYGLNGFDELNDKLKAIWTPDITKKQLPGVLEGLAPVRSFMAIGSGVKTLVTVLMSEYKQEGNLGKSLKKGGNVFLKTTTGDFVKLGVKLTSGTQAILENTEELFGGVGSNGRVYDLSLIHI